MEFKNSDPISYCTVCGTALTFEQAKIYDNDDNYVHCSYCGCIVFSHKNKSTTEKYHITQNI